MGKALNVIKWREVLPRIVIDFALIHAAMLIAIVISIKYQAHIAGSGSNAEMLEAFRRYYSYTFLPLSPLFPLIFFLNGIYTHVRSYQDGAKLRRFITVVLLSCAVFIGASFLLLPIQNPVGRSVALPFACLAIAGLLGARIAKEWLMYAGPSEQPVVEVPSSGQRPVLVIGGAGYIGSWLVRRLLESGQRVRVLDSAIYGLGAIQDILANPYLEFLHGDCRNIQDVVKAMRGVSSVVHLAAIVGDPACEVDRKSTIEINYASTRMLVEIAKGHGIERFLFASSCSVYGASDELMDEHSRVEPISLYGETKVSSEETLLRAASPTFHPVIMRFGTVFGLSSRPRFDLVVNLLSARAHQDGVITVFNGQQWRPFVHVKDLAEAIILLLQAPLNAVSSEIFNVGDNRLNHTLNDVADVIGRVFPGTRIEAVENSDRRNYRVNFSKIEKRVGFRCKYDLYDGVREIQQAFKSNQIVNYKDMKFSNLIYLRELGMPENKNDLDAEVMAAFGGEQIRRVVAAANLELEFPKAKTAVAN
jgi:nucleoside-diphosphate-sugar epimerase